MKKSKRYDTSHLIEGQPEPGSCGRVFALNKKSGPYNAYVLWLFANRWKEAPKAHYRTYPQFLYYQRLSCLSIINYGDKEKSI